MFKKLYQKTLVSVVFSLMTWVQIHAVNHRDCRDPCPPRAWGSAEYLYWQLKDSPATVPLVVSGPVVASGSPVLGKPGTKVVLGGKVHDNDFRSGGRLALGYWFDNRQLLGGEINYFFLGGRTKTESVSSSGQKGTRFLTLPYINAVTDVESSTPIALPGLFAGTAVLKVSNNMQGAEANCVIKFDTNCYDLNVLTGFRYLYFKEVLKFETNSPFVVPPIDIFNTTDRFLAQNNFYGGQMGFDGKYYWKQVFIRALGKVAVGAMIENVSIQGNLVTNDFDGLGAPETIPAGYFAMSTNKGNHKRTRFACVPEFGISLGYQIFETLSMQVGYTGLWVSEVVWASNQIDRKINPSQAPAISGNDSTTVIGKKRPKALFKTECLWAQGLTVGLDFIY